MLNRLFPTVNRLFPTVNRLFPTVNRLFFVSNVQFLELKTNGVKFLQRNRYDKTIALNEDRVGSTVVLAIFLEIADTRTQTNRTSYLAEET